jgi:hypothetical protein
MGRIKLLLGHLQGNQGSSYWAPVDETKSVSSNWVHGFMPLWPSVFSRYLITVAKLILAHPVYSNKITDLWQRTKTKWIKISKKQKSPDTYRWPFSLSTSEDNLQTAGRGEGLSSVVVLSEHTRKINEKSRYTLKAFGRN